MDRRTARPAARTAPRQAMTLIELIAVLALLAVVVALTGPSLSPFFRGRKLNEESRRLLALTRYGSNEAISRGVPMELWLNSQSGTYGLEPQAGYESEDAKARVEFEVSEGLKLELGADSLNAAGVATIVFWPDGSIDESSLESVIVRDENNNEPIRIGLTDTGLGYEIQTVDEVGVNVNDGR